jgi:hypothetical protein
MDITTTYKTNAHGRGQIVARGIGGKQKTTNYDDSSSSAANHGTAAARLIIHVNAARHPLERQNADDLRRSVVRSLDAGYGSHDSNDSGTVHKFSV